MGSRPYLHRPVYSRHDATRSGGPDATTRVETLFVTPEQRSTFRDGRTALLPMHYSAFPDYLERHPADLAILHVPPPRNGVFSCGLAADIAEDVRRIARRVAVLVNPQMPFTHGAQVLPADAADFWIDADGPLLDSTTDRGTDAASEAIAAHVAGLVRDGDALQFGIGAYRQPFCWRCASTAACMCGRA